jgi:hypothetical protein
VPRRSNCVAQRAAQWKRGGPITCWNCRDTAIHLMKSFPTHQKSDQTDKEWPSYGCYKKRVIPGLCTLVSPTCQVSLGVQRTHLTCMRHQWTHFNPNVTFYILNVTVQISCDCSSPKCDCSSPNVTVDVPDINRHISRERGRERERGRLHALRYTKDKTASCGSTM